MKKEYGNDITKNSYHNNRIPVDTKFLERNDTYQFISDNFNEVISTLKSLNEEEKQRIINKRERNINI
jgi:hypothetical protein